VRIFDVAVVQRCTMNARSLVLVVFVACHTSASPVATWSPASSGAYRSTDSFHVAVADARATWTNPPSFWPCAIEGATFLCGTTHVLAIHADRIEPEPTLERGRAPGTVETIVGSWPDDAWLVVRTEMLPNTSCGLCHYIAYRWRSDRWEQIAAFADWFPGRAAAWMGELFIVHDRPRRELAVVGTSPSPLARRIVTESRCAVLPEIVATPTMLFVLGAICGGGPVGMSADVTRWTEAGSTVDRPIPAPPDSAPEILKAVATSRGTAIFGAYSRSEDSVDKAVATRFEDGRWISRDPPGQGLLSYGVAPDGTEWAVVDDEDPMKGGVFAREPSGAWQRVDGWRAEALRYGATSTAWVKQVWVAEGSVWLEVVVEGACENTKGCEYRSLLLRTGPATPPVMLARDRGV